MLGEETSDVVAAVQFRTKLVDVTDVDAVNAPTRSLWPEVLVSVLVSASVSDRSLTFLVPGEHEDARMATILNSPHATVIFMMGACLSIMAFSLRTLGSRSLCRQELATL